MYNIKHILFIFLSLLLLTACGQDSSGSDSTDPDKDVGGTGIELPKVLQSTIFTNGEMHAYITVDKEPRQELVIFGNQASSTLNNLSADLHNFTIEFVFVYSNNIEQPVTLATASTQLDLSNGQNQLSFQDSDYNYLDYDIDGDTIPNLIELADGTDPFSATTVVPDKSPDVFSFTDQIGVALKSLIISNQITVSGITAATAISITGGEYSVNGGNYTGNSGTVSNGQMVTLRQTSSASFNTTTNATLTVGGVSDTFSVSTVSDTQPPLTSASLAEGIYNAQQSVGLSCTDAGSSCTKIYYTLDGSVPNTASSVYAAAIVISANTTLRFFAVDAAGNNESVKTLNYVIDVTSPIVSASVTGGNYSAAQSVSLTCSDSGSGCNRIYYTLDNTLPTTSSTQYTSALNIAVTTTLRFMATDNANNTSNVHTETYTITLPVYTVGGTVTGLAGEGLVLQNQSGAELAISNNGGFVFTTELSSQSSYFVSIKNHSAAQGCIVQNSTGVIAASNVTNVQVNCNVNAIGKWGGGLPQAVAIQGSYAYTAAAGVLNIMDISNPASPVPVSSFEITEYANEVAVSGNYAYVASLSDGLRIIDIRNQSVPVEVGYFKIPGNIAVSDVAINGNYAYIVAGGKFRVLDISIPSSPTEVSFVDVAASAVAVNGSYAYIASNGLRILDISNPALPIEVAFAAFSGGNNDVVINGSYAYIAGNGLRIFDISNPALPTELSNYSNLSFAEGVAVSGNYAYVANYVSDLIAIDVSNPSLPTYAGTYITPGRAQGVATTGNYVYVADDWGGLRVADVTVPESPVEVWADYTSGGRAWDVAINGNYIYLADLYGGLRILNVSNPGLPTETGFLASWPAQGVAISGNYAYVAASSRGLRIVDVSNPSLPTEVGFYDTPGTAWDVAVNGNYAYVADGSSSGLRIIDITNPGSPIEVGFLATPGRAFGVAVSGNTVYVSDDGGGGLRIIDVSNPAVPVELGFYIASNIEKVAISGNYAYLASTFSGLRVVDVSNPGSPVEVGVYRAGGYTRSVTVSGSYAYITDYSGELQIFDISNPNSLTAVGFYNTPGESWGIAVSGSYIYVAIYEMGLGVYQFLNN